MSALPEQQEKLLRELNSFESLDRKGIYPEKSNINLFLLVTIWIVGAVIIAISIFKGNKTALNEVIVAAGVASLSLIGAYYNQVWGKYLAVLSLLGINGFLTYKANFTYSEFLTLVDALTVFAITNQFGRNGYFLGLSLILGKATTLFMIEAQNQESYLEQGLAIIVNVAVLGILPLFISSISATSRRAKKQEIRAEILSLQNQDLIDSWLVTSSAMSNYSPTQIQSSANTQPTPSISSSNREISYSPVYSPAYTAQTTNNTPMQPLPTQTPPSPTYSDPGQDAIPQVPPPINELPAGLNSAQTPNPISHISNSPTSMPSNQNNVNPQALPKASSETNQGIGLNY